MGRNDFQIGDTVVIISNASYEYGGQIGDKGVVGTKGIITDKREMTNAHTGMFASHKYSLDYKTNINYDGTTFRSTRIVIVEKYI